MAVRAESDCLLHMYNALSVEGGRSMADNDARDIDPVPVGTPRGRPGAEPSPFVLQFASTIYRVSVTYGFTPSGRGVRMIFEETTTRFWY
jgi:hypothetical protein